MTALGNLSFKGWKALLLSVFRFKPCTAMSGPQSTQIGTEPLQCADVDWVHYLIQEEVLAVYMATPRVRPSAVPPPVQAGPFFLPDRFEMGQHEL